MPVVSALSVGNCSLDTQEPPFAWHRSGLIVPVFPQETVALVHHERSGGESGCVTGVRGCFQSQQRFRALEVWCHAVSCQASCDGRDDVAEILASISL